MPPQEDRLVFIGVDVAKAILAIQFPDQAWSTANTAQGHALFLKRLPAFGQIQVVCEATGGYERALVLALHQAGIAVSVINPRQIRDCRQYPQSHPQSLLSTSPRQQQTRKTRPHRRHA